MTEEQWERADSLLRLLAKPSHELLSEKDKMAILAYRAEFKHTRQFIHNLADKAKVFFGE